MKKWLYVIIVTAFFTGCRTIPANWWEDIPPNTPTASTWYFVGISPPNMSPEAARNAAEIAGRNQFVDYYYGVKIKSKTGLTVSVESSSKLEERKTTYENEVEVEAGGLVKKMMPIKYRTDKRERTVYVLMSIPNPHIDPDPNPKLQIWNQVTDLWWRENDINGTRVYASLEGWNFWYLNDDGYVYSDPLTARVLESIKNDEDENQFNELFPMIAGLGCRRPISGIVIVGAEVSTAKMSAGIGLSIPLFPYRSNSFNITPWVIGGFGWTNKQFPVPVFDGGLDFTFTLTGNRALIIGIDLTYIQDAWGSSPNWRTFGYGLSAGIKL